MPTDYESSPQPCQTHQQATAQQSHPRNVAHCRVCDTSARGQARCTSRVNLHTDHSSTRQRQNTKKASHSYRRHFAELRAILSLRPPAAGRVTLFRAATGRATEPRDERARVSSLRAAIVAALQVSVSHRSPFWLYDRAPLTRARQGQALTGACGGLDCRGGRAHAEGVSAPERMSIMSHQRE
jgi:hypothetical protein